MPVITLGKLIVRVEDIGACIDKDSLPFLIEEYQTAHFRTNADKGIMPF